MKKSTLRRRFRRMNRRMERAWRRGDIGFAVFDWHLRTICGV